MTAAEPRAKEATPGPDGHKKNDQRTAMQMSRETMFLDSTAWRCTRELELAARGCTTDPKPRVVLRDRRTARSVWLLTAGMRRRPEAHAEVVALRAERSRGREGS